MAKIELSKILICPQCKVSLTLENQSYVCPKCQQKFLIKDKIPLFLPFNLEEFKKKEIEYFESSSDKKIEFDQLNSWRNVYFHNKLILPFSSLRNKDLILEIGGGSGFDCLNLLKQGFRVIETDLSFKSLLWTKKNIENRVKKTNDVEFVVCDAENLPFLSGSFDGILMVATLHHFLNPEKALSEIERCIKKNGYVILGMEPAHLGMLFIKLKSLIYYVF